MEERQQRKGMFQDSDRMKDLFISNMEKTGNITQSAKLSGWSRSTAYRLKNTDPVFADRIDEARLTFLKNMGEQFRLEAPEALNTLVLVMKDTRATASAKVAAADKILQYAIQLGELCDTEESIAQLSNDLKAITGSFSSLQIEGD